MFALALLWLCFGFALDLDGKNIGGILGEYGKIRRKICSIWEFS
tara:strand:+ start:1467 stop:1598 length:132 start_codon:yes stop_codon:yes gene_type:complete